MGHAAPDVTFVREFRYDGARARYLSAELDPGAFQSGQYTTYLTRKWTDYDGNNAYRDVMRTPVDLAYETGFEPGIGRIRDLHDSPKGDYYFADHLGTTRWTIGAASGGTASYLFTAFGEPRTGPLDGGDNRYGYVGAFGYQAHDEMPFLHVGHRYYDPAIGRFLQRDPIGILGGLNPFLYAESRPTIGIDPDGLQYYPTNRGPGVGWQHAPPSPPPGSPGWGLKPGGWVPKPLPPPPPNPGLVAAGLTCVAGVVIGAGTGIVVNYGVPKVAGLQKKRLTDYPVDWLFGKIRGQCPGC